MFSTGQETTNTENLLLTHIWESECLGVGAYSHCVADSFPCDSLIAYYLKTSLSGQPFLTLISFSLFILILIHQFSLFILCGPFWALGVVLSCLKGQDTLVNFSLLPVVHEQVKMPFSCISLVDSKNYHPQDITVVIATCHNVKVSYDMGLRSTRRRTNSPTQISLS